MAENKWIPKRAHNLAAATVHLAVCEEIPDTKILNTT